MVEVKEKQIDGATKFIVVYRCLQCFHTNEFKDKCSQCGYLFLEEATQEEKNQANLKLIKMQEKFNES